jgi:hypothetical protein
MAEPIQAIRELVQHIDKTLSTRNLYAPDTDPYQRAGQALYEKYRSTVVDEEISIRVGPTDLFVGTETVLHRDKREASFFFPLYRDGLRELRFSAEATSDDLELFLDTLEAERKGLIGPNEDTVSFLWRCDLRGIHFAAIDGLGDQEGGGTDGSATDDYRSLVGDLMSKIQSPAPPETGQRYSFMLDLDADSKVAASDLHYEATTQHRAFEDNPTVLELSTEEVEGLRAEVAEENEEELLERFIEVLIVILTDPAGTVSGAFLSPVFEQLLEGYWKAEEYSRVSKLLTRLQATSQVAAVPESRVAARSILVKFLTSRRIEETLGLLESGGLALPESVSMWDLAGGEVWDLLVDFSCRLPKGELHAGVTTFLHKRLTANPALLSSTLKAKETERIRVGLSLIREGLEENYAKELFSLAFHPQEAVRLKAIAAVGRIGDSAAAEVLWKVIENDSMKSVRLLAFRLIGNLDFPQLPQRLQTIVTRKDFATRPIWEREKYVALLGSAFSASAQPLFESWIPSKRWFWNNKDRDQAQLALCGLAATGEDGLERVRALATAGSKLAPIAEKILRNLEHSTAWRKSDGL